MPALHWFPIWWMIPWLSGEACLSPYPNPGLFLGPILPSCPPSKSLADELCLRVTSIIQCSLPVAALATLPCPFPGFPKEPSSDPVSSVSLAFHSFFTSTQGDCHLADPLHPLAFCHTQLLFSPICSSLRGFRCAASSAWNACFSTLCPSLHPSPDWPVMLVELCFPSWRLPWLTISPAWSFSFWLPERKC